MTIMRIMVTDPEPLHPKDDIVVYQVPENSRACGLLITLLDRAGLDYIEIPGRPAGRKSPEK